MKEHKKISKLMSLVLRHQPEAIGVELDDMGWLAINALIIGIRKKGLTIDRDLLEDVVKTNDKQRFIISDDKLKIRANQGHSINVDLELQTIEPPEFLFHGTVAKFMEAIRFDGLKKMSRNHVHLSQDRNTATTVGSRRGKPIILKVSAGEMFRNKVNFYQSENGVWLTDWVDPKYIEFK